MSRVVNLRSPFFIRVDNTGTTNRILRRAFIDMFVWPVGATKPTTAQFEFQDDIVGNRDFLIFEIAEQARDYIDTTFSGTYSTDVVNIEVNLTRVFSTGDNAINLYTYFGIDGYEPFEGGMQYEDGTTTNYTEGMYLGSGTMVNGLIEIPTVDTEPVQIPTWNAIDNEVVYTTVAAGDAAPTGYRFVTDDSYEKREVVKITFVNKMGVLQDLWSIRKSVHGIKVNNDSYYQNIVDFNNMSYNPTRHSQTKYNVVGRRNISLMTGYYPESVNNIVEELFMSEQVWLTIGNAIHPVLLKNKNLKYLTHVNDKLVRYDFEFDYSNRIDNIIR